MLHSKSDSNFLARKFKGDGRRKVLSQECGSFDHALYKLVIGMFVSFRDREGLLDQVVLLEDLENRQ